MCDFIFDGFEADTLQWQFVQIFFQYLKVWKYILLYMDKFQSSMFKKKLYCIFHVLSLES